jgi:hypothetical protein
MFLGFRPLAQIATTSENQLLRPWLLPLETKILFEFAESFLVNFICKLKPFAYQYQGLQVSLYDFGWE